MLLPSSRALACMRTTNQQPKMVVAQGCLCLYVPLLLLMTTWGGEGILAWKGLPTADASSDGEFMAPTPYGGTCACFLAALSLCTASSWHH